MGVATTALRNKIFALDFKTEKAKALFGILAPLVGLAVSFRSALSQ